MKKRSQINEQFKWDLTKFCKNDAEWYEKFEQLKQLAPKIKQYKGQLGNADKLYDFYKLSEEMGKIASNITMYSENNSNVDLENTKYVEMNNLLVGLSSQISEDSAFYLPEMISYDESYFNELLSDERFKNEAFNLKEMLRSKPHILNEEQNKLLSQVGVFAGSFAEIFNVLTDTNITFDDAVNEKGKKLPLNHSSYAEYMRSKDRVLRKSAFENYYKTFQKFSDTISANYIASLRSDWFYAKTHKHESVFASELFSLNISKTVYDSLVKNVSDNVKLLQKYYKIKAQSLQLPDFTYYDQFVSGVSYEKKFSFDKSIELLKQALAPLGSDYVELIDRSVNERWIDIYPNYAKTSGAYQWSNYWHTPIILLNFKGMLDDVFTLAHEMGHAMHSHYSNTNQPPELAGYPIFLAEVASIVNEILLLKHLYGLSKNKREKIYYLEYYLQMFKSTLFRQTMFSEFEEHAHNLIQNNAPISKTVLNEYYKNLNKKYHGTSLKHNSLIELEWMRIPHFYGSFYVYKYATGIVSAISIASKIYNNAPNALGQYKTFLKAGGSDYPINILKQAGVDLETSEPYTVVFNEMQWAINELESLILGNKKKK